MDYLKTFKQIKIGTDVNYIFELFKITNEQIDILIDTLKKQNETKLTVFHFKNCKILNNEQIIKLTRYCFGGDTWCKICEERDLVALSNLKIL